MSDELVTIDISDGVADVRLNRVDKYNALSPAMFKAIIDAPENHAQRPAYVWKRPPAFTDPE